MTAESSFEFKISAQDLEDVRWYLEDYLQNPVEPTPQIAGRVESRLAELGRELFNQVFGTGRTPAALWDAVKGRVADTRLEIIADAEGTAGIPWELMRDSSNGVLALRAGAFVRTLSMEAFLHNQYADLADKVRPTKVTWVLPPDPGVFRP